MRYLSILLVLMVTVLAMLPGIVAADPPPQHGNVCDDSDEINGWAFVISGKGNGVYSIDFVSESGEVPITNWDLRTVHDTAELGSLSSAFSAMINNPTFSGVYTPVVACDHSRNAYSDSPPTYALPSAHIGTVTFTVDPGAAQDDSDDFYWDTTQGGAGHQTEGLLSAAVLAANGHLIVWCGDAGMPDECPTDSDKTEPGTCGCGVADTDTDSDGTPDCNDECPTDPNKVAPGICGCGVADADTDSDGDGTPDCNDECPTDASKVAPGICGCGVADTDSDSDGTADCNDGCPTDPNKVAPGICGCGVADTDSDSDGTFDCNDGCPTDPNKVAPGTCGCGVADTDSDSDGTLDCNDGCPTDPNKVAPGVCGCGVADTDSDSDGTLDCNDGCPTDPNKVAPGVCGCGVADTDSDSDGTLDCNDGCPTDPNKVAPGVCGCGVSDVDTDGDGTADCFDSEVCDGVDNDGDGQIDEGVQNTYYADDDDDNYGDPSDSTQACSQPSGYVSDNTDCNDGNASVNPGMAEIPCNGIDDDCSSATLDSPPDADGDGVTVCNGDCDDSDNTLYPGATELCDGKDNDCDGVIDEGGACDPIDADADGYPANVDCNDNDPTINPAAQEVCDGVDNDCDGQIDEGGVCGPPDKDGDGVADAVDNCPNTFNPGQSDRDGDGKGDACDRCPDDPTNECGGGSIPGMTGWGALGAMMSLSALAIVMLRRKQARVIR